MKWFKSKSKSESAESDAFDSVLKKLGYAEACRRIKNSIVSAITEEANRMRETQQPPLKPGDKVIVNKYKMYANDEDATICESWCGSPSVISAMIGEPRNKGVILRAVITGVDVGTDFVLNKIDQFIYQLTAAQMTYYLGTPDAVFAEFQKYMYKKTSLRDWLGLYWCVRFEMPEFEIKAVLAHPVFLREKSLIGRETARIWAKEIKREKMLIEAEELLNEIYDDKSSLRVAFIESLKQ